MRWEYKVQRWHHRDAGLDREQALNQLGADGWEVIDIQQVFLGTDRHPTLADELVYLKRPAS
jgi:hypothetical protein